jgi:hypothetical protein
MARRTDTSSINLQEAAALLLRNQAAFVAEMAAMNSRREADMRRWEENRIRSDARFAAIERELDEIKRILLQLPEAIRQKIGFKSE